MIFGGQVKVTALSPVCGNVDLGDLEVELGRAAHRDAVASCGKVQQLLLQLQGKGQHHVPEAPGFGGVRGRGRVNGGGGNSGHLSVTEAVTLVDWWPE